MKTVIKVDITNKRSKDGEHPLYSVQTPDRQVNLEVIICPFWVELFMPITPAYYGADVAHGKVREVIAQVPRMAW